MAEGLFEYSLWGLFLASFLAATVVLFSSEALLSLLIATGTDVTSAILVATAGNWLAGLPATLYGAGSPDLYSELCHLNRLSF